MHILPKTFAPTSWLVQPHGWNCFILFYCLIEVRFNVGTLIRSTFFSVSFCEFQSSKGSSKINKSKAKSLLSSIKLFVLKHGFHFNLKIIVL